MKSFVLFEQISSNHDWRKLLRQGLAWLIETRTDSGTNFL
jgi:hypothetical protein